MSVHFNQPTVRISTSSTSEQRTCVSRTQSSGGSPHGRQTRRLGTYCISASQKGPAFSELFDVFVAPFSSRFLIARLPKNLLLTRNGLVTDGAQFQGRTHQEQLQQQHQQKQQGLVGLTAFDTWPDKETFESDVPVSLPVFSTAARPVFFDDSGVVLFVLLPRNLHPILIGLLTTVLPAICLPPPPSFAPKTIWKTRKTHRIQSRVAPSPPFSGAILSAGDGAFPSSPRGNQHYANAHQDSKRRRCPLGVCNQRAVNVQISPRPVKTERPLRN